MQQSEEVITEVDEKEYYIKRLKKSTLTDLAKLHAAVYVPVPTDFYFNKYNTSFTGVENVGFIAYNKAGLPIAFYGVLPCFIRFGKTVVLAAQSADTMTHPLYRYKGMFVTLSKMTFDLCQQLQIKLLFGFPNQNSYYGAVSKLGWEITHNMECFVIPVKALPIAAFTKKNKWLLQCYTYYKKRLLKQKKSIQKGISNSVISEGFAGVDRTTDYLLYKTFSPAEVIQIGSATVWISIKTTMMIGDMQGVGPDNFDFVMKSLKRIAKKLGIRQIQFHASEGTHLHKLFKTQYAAIPSYPVLFQNFGASIPLEKIKFSFADLDIF